MEIFLGGRGLKPAKKKIPTWCQKIQSCHPLARNYINAIPVASVLFSAKVLQGTRRISTSPRIAVMSAWSSHGPKDTNMLTEDTSRKNTLALFCRQLVWLQLHAAKGSTWRASAFAKILSPVTLAAAVCWIQAWQFWVVHQQNNTFLNFRLFK